MYGDQEAIRPLIRELVAISLEGFMLGLPHAEAIVGLRSPIFQVVHDNFVAGIIALHALKDYFALLPLFILACATPVLVSTFQENAAVSTVFFCQGIG